MVNVKYSYKMQYKQMTLTTTITALVLV